MTEQAPATPKEAAERWLYAQLPPRDADTLRVGAPGLVRFVAGLRVGPAATLFSIWHFLLLVLAAGAGVAAVFFGDMGSFFEMLAPGLSEKVRAWTFHLEPRPSLPYALDRPAADDLEGRWLPPVVRLDDARLLVVSIGCALVGVLSLVPTLAFLSCAAAFRRGGLPLLAFGVLAVIAVGARYPALAAVAALGALGVVLVAILVRFVVWPLCAADWVQVRPFLTARRR